jgi:putative NADH-flavin reductase
MRIVVVGAAGRTGRQAVERALGHGHEVLAFVHTTPLALSDPRLQTATGDVRDFEAVSAAISGSDAVISAFAGGGSGAAGIYEAGIANIIYAMAEAGVMRLAAVSAAGTFDRTNKKLSLVYRAMLATAMRSTYDDLEAMERRIMASALEWTIVRPGALSDDPPTGEYRVSLDGSLLPKAGRISRADLASVLVKAVETDTFLRRAIVVAT